MLRRAILFTCAAIALATPSVAAPYSGYYQPRDPFVQLAAFPLLGVVSGSGGGGSCPANDGHVNDGSGNNAPGVSAKMPSLLTSYSGSGTTITAKLNCQVAGVSSGYGVGWPTLPTKDPANLFSDIPVSEGYYTAASGTNAAYVTLNGTTANVVIDGYDFCKNGGVILALNTSTGNITVKNSRFCYPNPFRSGGFGAGGSGM